MYTDYIILKTKKNYEINWNIVDLQCCITNQTNIELIK